MVQRAHCQMLRFVDHHHPAGVFQLVHDLLCLFPRHPLPDAQLLRQLLVYPGDRGIGRRYGDADRQGIVLQIIPESHGLADPGITVHHRYLPLQVGIPDRVDHVSADICLRVARLFRRNLFLDADRRQLLNLADDGMRRLVGTRQEPGQCRRGYVQLSCHLRLRLF